MNEVEAILKAAIRVVMDDQDVTANVAGSTWNWLGLAEGQCPICGGATDIMADPYGNSWASCPCTDWWFQFSERDGQPLVEMVSRFFRESNGRIALAPKGSPAERQASISIEVTDVR